MRVAHAVVIVTMPGLGDEIQVSKAGLMEIGDIYVVNKADLPGADGMVVGLLGIMRDRRRKEQGAPVLKVSALTREGIDRLVSEIERLRTRFLSSEGEKLRLRSTQGMITELAKRRVISRFEADGLSDAAAELARSVVARELSIEQATTRLADLATTERSKNKRNPMDKAAEDENAK
jgi:LAO/AO transport system kinase